MKKGDLEERLKKFSAENLPDPDERDLEKWYAAFERDEGCINKLTEDEKEALEKRLLQKINQYIDLIERSNTIKVRTLACPSKKKPDWFYSYRYKVAAILIAMLIMAALANGFLLENRVTHSTAYGQTRHIIFPDSSTVILNGNSSLSYSRYWSKEWPREVFLDGEGFFSVRPTANHQKFMVNTSEQVNIEVLGTEFNVSKRESGTRVVLNSGEVRLNIKNPDGQEQVVMKPGDLVAFKDKPAEYIKKVVNPAVYSSWKDKKLILDRTSLREILLMLKESYGLRATVADQGLLDQKVSGSIPVENVNRLLRDIAVTYSIRVTKKADTIEIHKAPEE